MCVYPSWYLIFFLCVQASTQLTSPLASPTQSPTPSPSGSVSSVCPGLGPLPLISQFPRPGGPAQGTTQPLTNGIITLRLRGRGRDAAFYCNSSSLQTETCSDLFSLSLITAAYVKPHRDQKPHLFFFTWESCDRTTSETERIEREKSPRVQKKKRNNTLFLREEI